MSLLRGFCALLVLLICATPLRAEMIGHFQVGECSDEGCEILAPSTGEALQWRLTKKELAVANKAYDALIDADNRLAGRGFNDVARVAFAYSTFYHLTEDGWVTEVVLDAFLYDVHQNRIDEVGEAVQSFNPYPWIPIANIAGISEYHPTTGARLSTGSVRSRAQSLPDCYKNGAPAQDCRPIRYNHMMGCLLSPADQQAFAEDVEMWMAREQADLGTIMTAEQESQLDLSTARVVESAPKKAPEKPKKTADNPAGRSLCEY